MVRKRGVERAADRVEARGVREVDRAVGRVVVRGAGREVPVGPGDAVQGVGEAGLAGRRLD